MIGPSLQHPIRTKAKGHVVSAHWAKVEHFNTKTQCAVSGGHIKGIVWSIIVLLPFAKKSTQNYIVAQIFHCKLYFKVLLLIINSMVTQILV